MRVMPILAAAVLATGSVVIMPAAPAFADGTALDTIARGQADGYQVNIDRVGSGPIEDCVVTSVRNPNTITRLQRVGDRLDGNTVLVPVIVSQTVQISLYCAG